MSEPDSAARTIRTEYGGERRWAEASVLQGARYAEWYVKVSFLGFIHDPWEENSLHNSGIAQILCKDSPSISSQLGNHWVVRSYFL